jgi:phage/plasmid-like protein (TIGR03299 family)
MGIYIGDAKYQTAEEAVRNSPLNWEVGKYPVIGIDPETGEDIGQPDRDHFAVIRKTDGKILGQVGKKYSIVQNYDAFAFLDRAAGDKLILYETCGVFNDGKQIWIIAKLVGMTIEPVPGDVCQMYALLASGHDGRLSLIANIILGRPSCSNALVAAIKSSKSGITIRHSGNVADKMKTAEKVLKLAQKQYEHFGRAAEVLAKTQIDSRDWGVFLDSLIGEIDEDKPSARLRNQRAELTRLFEEGPGTDIPGVNGTAWGALNAVTAWTTHSRSTRGHGGDEDKAAEKRLESVFFGTGNDMNQKAMSLLLA